MSFVEQDDVFCRRRALSIHRRVRGIRQGQAVTKSWPRIPFAEALRKYGSDKPDLRNPIVMQDASEHFRGSGSRCFARMLEDPKKPGVGDTRARRRQPRLLRPDEFLGAGRGQPGLGYIMWREGGEGAGSSRQQYRPRSAPPLSAHSLA